MTTTDTWLEDWLREVASGSAKMSQRAITSIEKHGGVDALVQAARELGVHLVRLKDDKGNDLVAASTAPFTTLC